MPAMVIFHTANAWQEGDDIVKLAACTFDEVSQISSESYNASATCHEA